jgi:cobalt/nickel transport system permease protein
MEKISADSFDIGYMDALASGTTALHRLDPRAKLLVTLFFITAVVSFNKYEVSALVPFALYPVFLISAGELPPGYLLGKVLLASPLAVLVGVFNPLLDRQALLHFGPLAVSGGWVSFVSILARFLLTVMSALALLALTGINGVCEGLSRLGVPGAFVVQLLFLNRYLLVLTGEASAMSRARALRGGARRMRPGLFAQIAGHLLLRTLDRAERVYRAMLARGFSGRLRVARSYSFGGVEVAFTAVWTALFVFFRFMNIPLLLGDLITGTLK